MQWMYVFMAFWLPDNSWMTFDWLFKSVDPEQFPMQKSINWITTAQILPILEFNINSQTFNWSTPQRKKKEGMQNP